MKAARWKAPGSTIALAALALVAALAAPPAAAEEPGALKVSCKGGQVSLEAHAASALHVFRALEEECGLQLKGGENIPDEPVTATYEKVALEDIIESLIHLLGLSSTLLAIDSSGALKLSVLSSGTPGPSRPRLGRTREERPKSFKERAERRSQEVGKSDEERRQALERWRESRESGESGFTDKLRMARERRQEN